MFYRYSVSLMKERGNTKFDIDGDDMKINKEDGVFKFFRLNHLIYILPIINVSYIEINRQK